MSSIITPEGPVTPDIVTETDDTESITPIKETKADSEQNTNKDNTKSDRSEL